MGVLDEAIRQHIELKRRHGASEQELQRKEEEALGPARRGAQADGDEGDEAGADATPAAQAAPDSEPAETPFSEQETRIFSAADEPEDVALVDEPDESVLPDPPEVSEVDGEPDAEPALPERDAEPAAGPAPVDDWLEPDPAPEPPPAPPARDAPRLNRFGDPPLGVEREDVARPRANDHADDDEPEDVLEETPEFLQETPEHDRLWFEQKPPRDFDFDDDK